MIKSSKQKLVLFMPMQMTHFHAYLHFGYVVKPSLDSIKKKKTLLSIILCNKMLDLTLHFPWKPVFTTEEKNALFFHYHNFITILKLYERPCNSDFFFSQSCKIYTFYLFYLSGSLYIYIYIYIFFFKAAVRNFFFFWVKNDPK